MSACVVRAGRHEPKLLAIPKFSVYQGRILPIDSVYNYVRQLKFYDPGDVKRSHNAAQRCNKLPVRRLWLIILETLPVAATYLTNLKNQSAVSTVIGRHLKIERTQELKNPNSLQNYFQDVLV